MSADLGALEKLYEREAHRIEAAIGHKPRPSAWLAPARDAFRQAAAATAQARVAEPVAASELVTIAEAYAEVARASERLARMGGRS